MTAPKIFVFDIETSPIVAHIWNKWPKFVSDNQILQDWYMLSWAGRYLGEEEIHYDSCDRYKGELDDWASNDYHVCETLRAVLSECDWLIAHNGIKFDIRKFNARLIQHGMEPLPPIKIIDTLKEVKRVAQFTSHSLDYLANTLLGHGKVKHEGHTLWVKCMAGDQEAWDKMVEYNIGDITVLEELYLYLRPYMKNHPNWGAFDESEEAVCPRCGGKHLHKRGFAYTAVSKFQRYQCTDCSAWFRGGTNLLTKEKRKVMLRNAV